MKASDLEILRHINKIRRDKNERPLTLEELQTKLEEMHQKGYVTMVFTD